MSMTITALDSEMGRNVRTYAVQSTSETLHFFGELAERYDNAFKRYKENSGIMSVNPALSFLAENDFCGFATSEYQKVDFIQPTLS